MSISHIQHTHVCSACRKKGLTANVGQRLSSMWLEPRAMRTLDPKLAAPQQTEVGIAIMQTCIVYIYMVWDAVQRPAIVCIHWVHK